MKRLAIFSIMILTVLAANAVGQGNLKAGGAGTVTVPGMGTVTVPADSVTITVSVDSNKENATFAKADIEEKMNKTIDALMTAGVRKDEIIPSQTSSIMSAQSYSKVCRTVNNNTTCDVSESNATKLAKFAIISLKTTDESKINKVLDAGRSEGAYAEVTWYGLSDPAKAFAQARKKAVEDAKSNADGIASAAGARLGKVVDISEPYRPYISESGKLGMVDVTSYVVVTYEIAG